jgi:hypothetical protein
VRRFEALRERGCDLETAVVVAVHPEIGVEEASDPYSARLRAPWPASDPSVTEASAARKRISLVSVGT